MVAARCRRRRRFFAAVDGAQHRDEAGFWRVAGCAGSTAGARAARDRRGAGRVGLIVAVPIAAVAPAWSSFRSIFSSVWSAPAAVSWWAACHPGAARVRADLLPTWLPRLVRWHGGVALTYSAMPGWPAMDGPAAAAPGGAACAPARRATPSITPGARWTAAAAAQTAAGRARPPLLMLWSHRPAGFREPHRGPRCRRAPRSAVHAGRRGRRRDLFVGRRALAEGRRAGCSTWFGVAREHLPMWSRPCSASR